jgi:hypothetical protein
MKKLILASIVCVVAFVVAPAAPASASLTGTCVEEAGFCVEAAPENLTKAATVW